jgi:hypothetical protein
MSTTITITRVESSISHRNIVRVYGTHGDEGRVFSCPGTGGYVRHGMGADGSQVYDLGTTMLQVFKGQSLAEVMAEYFGRNWDKVVVQDELFKVGDRVLAAETGAGETGVMATITKISVDGFADLDFDDGDAGTYDIRELSPAE